MSYLFYPHLKKRWTTDDKHRFCAHAAGCDSDRRGDYDVIAELKHHDVDVARFDEWFTKWRDAGHPYAD